MKVNIIKWDEGMNKRCLKRIAYEPVIAYDRPLIKRTVNENGTYKSNNDKNYDDIHAISVGERIECELVVG